MTVLWRRKSGQKILQKIIIYGAKIYGFIEHEFHLNRINSFDKKKIITDITFWTTATIEIDNECVESKASPQSEFGHNAQDTETHTRWKCTRAGPTGWHACSRREWSRFWGHNPDRGGPPDTKNPRAPHSSPSPSRFLFEIETVTVFGRGRHPPARPPSRFPAIRSPSAAKMAASGRRASRAIRAFCCLWFFFSVRLATCRWH